MGAAGRGDQPLARHGRTRAHGDAPAGGSRLQPRWVERLEPRIRELTRSLLAEVLERPAFDFTAVLPSDVMCELVGIPAADRAPSAGRQRAPGRWTRPVRRAPGRDQNAFAQPSFVAGHNDDRLAGLVERPTDTAVENSLAHGMA